jgi:hypothetical protein
MADEKDSAPRARPFTPPLPPFRGPATASRPPVTPLTPPEVKRGSLFVGTRAPSKPAPEPTPVPIETAAITPAPIAERAAEPEAERPGTVYIPTEPIVTELPPAAVPIDEPDAARAEAIAATEAMPWLFADPGASQPVGGPPEAADSIDAVVVPGEEAAPDEAAHALSGLPYFDQSGAPHRAEEIPDAKRSSGKVHRIDFDVASVFESIAARLRSGEIDASDVDAAGGEAAVVATVLATLLRQRAR